MLRDRDLEWLLEDLCTKQGYCLPSLELQRLRDNPPTDPERFATAVLRAERRDPASDRRQYRDVLVTVERAFRKAADRDI
jgi:hypothetical protein